MTFRRGPGDIASREIIREGQDIVIESRIVGPEVNLDLAKKPLHPPVTSFGVAPEVEGSVRREDVRRSASLCCISSKSLLSSTPREFRAILFLYDFKKLEKDLEKNKITVDYILMAKKRNIFLHEKQFRLIRFFSLGFYPDSSADSSDQQLFDAKHLLAHAMYNETEYSLVLKMCEHNKAFVEKYNINVSNVKELIKNMRSIQASANLRFLFFVGNKKHE